MAAGLLLSSTSPTALDAGRMIGRYPTNLLSRVHPALPMRPEAGPPPGVSMATGESAADGFDADRLYDLIEKFEAACEAADDNNTKAERDIDYYDGKQLLDSEAREIAARGQAPIVDNRVRRKIDFLQGMERSQRTDPRAMPQNPSHEDEAHAATDALRAVCGQNKFDQLRSGMWADMLKVGWGGIEVFLEERSDNPNPRVSMRKCQWDRMFWDPYSCEVNFSDADYLGLVIWMDRAEAIRRYGEKASEVYDETIASASLGTMYDDRPAYSVWVDTEKRRRIRVVQMYFRDDDGVWNYAEFTKGGYLQYGVSPWVDQDGDPEHPYVWRACYVDRENNRYGVIRDMVDQQDMVNKLSSRIMHFANVRQTFGVEGSLGTMTTRQLRKELTKPDGHIALAPGIEFGKHFGVIPTGDMAAALTQLLELHTNALDLQGPNASMQGKGPQDQSGRAILAQQQGGQLEVGPQMDTLRDGDQEVYEKAWRRIRQGWTAEEWVRITDDQKNVQFVGLNQYKRAPVVNPMTGQPMVDPKTGQPATQVVVGPDGQPVVEKNDVGRLGVDITIEDAPKMGQLRAESFQTLAGMVKFVPDLQRLPGKEWVRLSGIDTAAEVMNALDEVAEQQQQQQANPQLQQVEQLKLAGAQAEIANKQADAQSKQASAVHKVAQAKSLEVQTAVAAMHGAHDHADHLVDAAHGGLPPDHFIPQAQQQAPQLGQ